MDCTAVCRLFSVAVHGKTQDNHTDGSNRSFPQNSTWQREMGVQHNDSLADGYLCACVGGERAWLVCWRGVWYI